jgi:hypothetical protein
MTTHTSTALIAKLRLTADQMRINAELPQKAYTRTSILLAQAARLKALADELEENAKIQAAQTPAQPRLF